MKKLGILTDPNPILRETASEVVSFDGELQTLIDDMVYTMRESNGIGLAAPQVGESKRLLVIEFIPEEGEETPKIPLTVLINPTIINESKNKIIMPEGCLSFPGKEIYASRPEKISVCGQDRWGKKVNFEADGLFARVLQHEIDHVNGILMVDYIRKIDTIFVGNGSLGLPVLERMADDPQFNILAVITGIDKPAGRKKAVKATQIAEIAKELSLRTFKVDDINKKENISLLKKLNPEVIICTDFTQIIGDEILNLPKLGVLNIHPSLLPKYRGPSPLQTTILNRDTKTGVSIIKMVKEMDAGPILAQIEAKLSRKVDYQTLKAGLAEIGAELIAELMPYYLAGEVQPAEQNKKIATYTKLFSKSAGEVKLTDNPIEVEAKIRAFQEWPKVYIILNDRKIFITKARLDKNKQIVIEKVKPEGKNEMNYADFIRGNSERLTFGK